MAKDIVTPTYNAYVVTKREGKDDWWSQIGSGWSHGDGLGINLILLALPIPGPDGECKIVLRPPKSDRDDSRDTDQPPRQENNNRRTRSR